MIEKSSRNPWLLVKAIGFRSVTIFFILYIFPFPLTLISAFEPITQLYSDGCKSLVVWVADHVLLLSKPIVLFDSDIGDKVFDFVFLFTVTLISLLTATIWSILDRKNAKHEIVRHWLLVIVRYYLATAMVFYGTAKIFHLQMPPPTLFELVQPFGDKTPMGLAWSYIGFSAGFSAFVGWVELLGGLLLFFRKTSTLGALVVATVMLNVVVMNLAFEIPVKLYSSLLLLMAIFLIQPDMDRLTRVLLLNKLAQPRLYREYLIARWQRITALVVKIVFIASVLIGNIASCFERVQKHGKNRAVSPLYGIYDTERFILNGDTLAPITTDSKRWQQLIMDFPDHAHIKFMNDSVVYCPIQWNIRDRKIVLSPGHPNEKSIFAYKRLLKSLQLEGTIGSDSVKITLRERDLKSFNLINTEFRWIQEY
ncbi:hypothetical protein ACFOET_08725 [Parapedobacter deserti]|uniref:DoxX family protein n=1 Tax=Parapedobacter deserti TaxID=1912957 RepID=A0ABV7JI84_9SPHI